MYFYSDEEAEEGDNEDESEESEEEEEEEEESSSSSESEEESDLDVVDALDRERLAISAKKKENRLAALKKANYLLKANVDRHKDDLFKQREQTLTLQQDLDSVLAELG